MRPPPEYYRHVRWEFVDWIEGVPERVLDVGCGTGNTLAHLMTLGVQETYGIELDGETAAEARENADFLLVGDVEELELPYEPGTLDYILLGDVLEHLRDPWRVLASLVPFLRDGGHVLGSVPNVRFYGVSLGLTLLGRWEYAEQGILDRTHLRFFTRKSARQLFEGAGLRIVDTVCAYGPKRAVFNAVTLGIFSDLLARQHLVKAAKVPPPAHAPVPSS